MSGTRLTDPGQGASVRQIRLEILASPRFSHLYATDASIAFPAMDRLYRLAFDAAGNGAMNEEYRTDIALTGEPLTADDIENISRAR